MINIKTLEANTNFEDLYVLIHSTEKKFTTDGKMFLDFTFQDITGTVNAKLWSASEKDYLEFVNGTIVKIAGDVTIFRKENQIRIRKIELYEGMDVGHFLPSAPIEKDELIERILNYTLKIENNILRKIVDTIIDKYYEDFFIYPAASKNHHEYVSGLAHHVLGMLELCEFIISKHPMINKDLLYSGVILHDFGKVIELSGVVSTEYTTYGKLLGHITIACNEIYSIAKEHKLEQLEEVMLLQHMILAHHGKLEFGSPKLPFIMEAEILSIVDNLDARINMLESSLNGIDDTEFTSRLFAMENRRFYKHSL
ncbi:MAG: HD domain-containing protein [Bacilli bacterium]